MFHYNAAFKSSFVSKLLTNCFSQKSNVVLFKPFVEELTWNFNGQNFSVELDRFDWLEPCFETLSAYIVFNDLQAFGPNTLASFLNSGFQEKGFVVSE